MSNKSPLKNSVMFCILIVCIVAIGGCLISDPDFRPNSKDAIIASKKRVVVTPEAKAAEAVK